MKKSVGGKGPELAKLVQYICHKVRTPLSTINNELEVLRLTAPDADLGDSKESVAQITRELEDVCLLLTAGNHEDEFEIEQFLSAKCRELRALGVAIDIEEIENVSVYGNGQQVAQAVLEMVKLLTSVYGSLKMDISQAASNTTILEIATGTDRNQAPPVRFKNISELAEYHNLNGSALPSIIDYVLSENRMQAYIQASRAALSIAIRMNNSEQASINS